MKKRRKPGPPPMPANQKVRRCSVSLDPEMYAAAKASGNISRFIRALYRRKRSAA